MNDTDPQAWLAAVLARLPDLTASQVPDLLPWNWKAQEAAIAASALKTFETAFLSNAALHRSAPQIWPS